jgi:Bacterial SCP ortholog
VPRLQPQDPAAVADALRREERTKADLKLLTKHFLAVLSEQAPGKSVEVRVPPYAAAQVVPGVRHTRGTPPAVIELDATTWIALATGEATWQQAVDDGRVRASGERADLTPYLPLTA